MSKKSTTTTGPSKFAQPFITQGANSLQAAYDANAGKIQGYTDQVVGSLLPSLQERWENGDPGVNAARDYNMSVLSGDYLDGNPHLQSVIDYSNDDIMDRVNALAGLRGYSGGSNHAGILAREVGRNSSNLRYTDYARERGAQDAAAGRASNIAAADYLPVSGLLSTLQASTTPVNAAAQYAGSLGGLLGGYQSQSGGPGAGQVLGNIAQTAAMAALFSERRVKKDISKVSAFDDGLNVYNFRYVWDSDDAPLHTGVMADEVEKLRPWALGPIVDGIQTVDYTKLEKAV